MESTGQTKSIIRNETVLKSVNDVIPPLTEDNKVFVDYSENGKDGEWNLPDAEFTKAKVYNMTSDGNEYVGEVSVEDKKIKFDFDAGQAVVIKSI